LSHSLLNNAWHRHVHQSHWEITTHVHLIEIDRFYIISFLPQMSSFEYLNSYHFVSDRVVITLVGMNKEHYFTISFFCSLHFCKTFSSRHQWHFENTEHLSWITFFIFWNYFQFFDVFLFESIFLHILHHFNHGFEFYAFHCDIKSLNWISRYRIISSPEIDVFLFIWMR